MDQDTSPEQLRRYHDLLRSLTPAERAKKAAALSSSVRKLALAGLRQRHPHATPHELTVRLCVRLYGRDFAARVFGQLPFDAV